MKNLILCFCFLSIPITLLSQNVSGNVSNEDGDALIGASILVKDTTVGTVTNLKGNFSLDYNGDFPFIIEISYISHVSKEIEITQSVPNLSVKLKEGILIGQEIIVSASRKREKIQEAPASISVLTSRKLAGSPQVDPVRNLINVPGVQIQQQSASRFNIEMRGGIGLFGTNVFPIMDYRSLVGPGIGTFASDQSGISRIDLERIEVVRGPGSALYGPGVTTGVMHFITKNPIDHPGTTIEVGGGELNTFISSVRHAGRNATKTFGYKINASYNRGDEFTLNPNDSIEASQIALFKTAIIDPIITNDLVDLTQPGRILLTQEDLDPDEDGNRMQDYWWNASVNTTLEFRPQADLAITLAGGMNTGSTVFYNDLGEGLAQAIEFWTQARVQKGGLFAQFFYLNNNGGNDKNPSFLYQTGVRTFSVRDQLEGQLQYNFKTPAFLKADWTVGIDFREVITDTKHSIYGRQEDKDDYRIFGGYVQGKFPLASKFDLFVAGRYDNISFSDEGAFSPRVAAVYKPSPKHSIRASFNRTVSLPTALVVYIDFPLNAPIPGLFDVWLAGMFEPHTFEDNPTIDVTLPGVPNLAYGTPGLPLAVPFQAVNPAVLAQLLPGLETIPELAPVFEPIKAYFESYSPSGFTGELVGVNVFNGRPLTFTSLIPTQGPNLTKASTYEVGYKGLLNDKLSFSADIYHIRTKGARFFSQIAPLMTLQGANIAADLGATVGNDFDVFLTDLLTPLVGADEAASLSAQLTPIVANTYTQGGQGFVEQVPAPLLSTIFGAVETSRVPMNDGVVHVPIGYRTLKDATSNRWGMDYSLEYHINKDLSVWANYSWVSDVRSNANNTEDSRTFLSALGNTPNNKYRLGLIYAPTSGFRSNLSFQHNDGFTSGSGQYSGEVLATNLVDASVGYQLSNGLTFDLTATNLFNVERSALPRMPKIGRRIILKMIYHFNKE